MPKTQTLPDLRKGQRISIVKVGKARPSDQAQIIEINAKKNRIKVKVDSHPVDNLGFYFLFEFGQWRYFFETSHGD